MQEGDVSSQTTRFIMEESEQEIQGHWFALIALRIGPTMKRPDRRVRAVSSRVSSPCSSDERECEEKRKRRFCCANSTYEVAEAARARLLWAASALFPAVATGEGTTTIHFDDC